MTWYTGIMLAPYGELVSYVHMGYASQYSNYLLIAVKDGVVTMCKDMTLSQLEEFKARQFQKFKATRQYREIYRRLKKILRKTGGKKIWAEEIHHIDDLIEANIFDNINELL
ncbi:MAG: hypothetical protein LUE10_03260 [Alistipes sp.]|nr:hypothetical protein [Alistipes sp.]